MALSYVEYEGDGSDTSFAVPFPYIDQSHVTVLVSDVETEFSWLTASTIEITPAPANGATVRIDRNTPDELLVTFTGGNQLTQANLNLLARQSFYRSIEAEERQPLPVMPAPENRVSTLFSYDADGVFELRPIGSIFDVDGQLVSLPDEAVTTASIDDRAVTGQKIALATVANENLADNAVGTSEIADGAVTDAKMAQQAGFGVKGRETGTGPVQTLTAAQLLTGLLGGVALVAGWTYQPGSDATNDIDISAGMGVGSSGRLMIGSAMTKQLDASWAAGTNQGGRIGSLADGGYFVWAIGHGTTFAVDYAMETDANATPTLPTGYTHYFKVGWIKRLSSANVSFKTYAGPGGSLEFYWTAPTVDVTALAAGTPLSTSRLLSAVKVPPGSGVIANVLATASHSASAFNAWVGSPDEADGAPSATATPLITMAAPTAGTIATATLRIRTNTSAQIAARSSIATIDAYRVKTIGFEMPRQQAA